MVDSSRAETPQAKANRKEVEAEHELVGNTKLDPRALEASRTRHPDAQWFPDAGLGLFLHWDIATVKPIALSWPMIPEPIPVI